MATLTTSSTRTTIDVAEASEIARMARANDPNVLSRENMESLLGHSALVLDGLRRRPRYFDGRFLTGADMTRDQEYIRQRQADLARATGTGVVSGLQVSMAGSAGGETLVIAPGHGVTPTGDIVMVTTRRSIAPLDLPTVERLDASMGLRLRPRLPLGRRTGLFLLALRSVEFTANPIAAYPTTITGPRQIEDGDVIEATAITLIPFPDTGGAANLAEARRAVARSIFLGQTEGLPQDALPLAMIAMDRGSIRWIDMAMVRRETGADTPLQVSMGARPRALAEAFVAQYQGHLSDVLRDRAASGLSPAFAAAQYFAALPAAGQLPAATILTDPLGFRQLWFPPAVDVDISFVPVDEVAALVEESLALPPIDLLGDPLDLDATGIVVLAPVTRPALRRFEQVLTNLSMTVLSSPAQGIRKAPVDMLAALLAKRTKFLEAATRDAQAAAAAATADAQVKAWQAAWSQAVSTIPVTSGSVPLLWYIRRRAVPYESRITGIAVAVAGDDSGLQDAVQTHLTTLGLMDRVRAIETRATQFASARVIAFLGAPRIIVSTMLTGSAVRDLEAAMPIVRADTPPVGITTPPILPPVTTVTPPPRPPAPAAAASTTPAPTTGAGATPTASTTPPVTLTSLTTGLVPRPGISRLVGIRAVLPPTPATLLTEADVNDVASDYADIQIGDGLDRLKAALGTNPLDQAGELWIAGNGLALDLDQVARKATNAALVRLADGVRKAVTDRDANELKNVIAAAG
jgi:hypothetical protein